MKLDDISFQAADEAAIQCERHKPKHNLATAAYESLLGTYYNTTHSFDRSEADTPKMAKYGGVDFCRMIDILRHEFLNCVYDMELWRIRTRDTYPENRIKAMKKFLKDFDEALK